MREAAELDPVVITSVGMVSALGEDAVTACAASRAGIRRPRKIDYFRVRSRDADEIETVVGYAAPMITLGFENDARLVRLLAAALRDLRSSIGPNCNWPAGFYLSMPSPARHLTGLKLMQRKPPGYGQVMQDEPTLDAVPQTRVVALLSQAVELAGWSTKPELRFVSGSGHTGVAEAVAKAITDLRDGTVTNAIVGGLDSLLDERTLGWLHATGRLKTVSAPVGLQPGEACALFHVKRQGPVRTKCLAVLSGVSITHESATLLSGQSSLGTGLSQSIMSAADSTELKAADRAWLITDQNGENYRASEWGTALSRIAARCPAFANTALWYPAVSFGDTGAASGAISVCLASISLRRGYAPQRFAFVSSSSEGTSRATLVVSAVEN